MARKMLDLPIFYDRVAAMSDGYRPSVGLLSDTVLPTRGGTLRGPVVVRPSREDAVRITLLLIDMQPDFCQPTGALPVLGRSGKGALMDSVRVAEFIYRNAAVISEIVATADTHSQLQIFFPSAWRLMDTGRMPEPHTLIGIEDGKLVNRALDGGVIGEVVPDAGLLRGSVGRTRKWLVSQMKFYVRTLEENGRPHLYLWPYHCIDGTRGQGIMPVVHEAMIYHGFLRGTAPRIMRKGMNPLTEHYSVFRPEVTKTHDGSHLVPEDSRLIGRFVSDDAVIVAGEASSHCVAASLLDVVKYCRLNQIRPDNFYLLTDCMSPFVVPGADFTDRADAALKRCADAGMRLVDSVTPVEEWPDFPFQG